MIYISFRKTASKRKEESFVYFHNQTVDNYWRILRKIWGFISGEQIIIVLSLHYQFFFLFKSLSDSSEERSAIFHTIARAWFQLRGSRILVAVNYINYA